MSNKSLLRILMLEDDPNDAELVRELLEADHFVCDFTLVRTRVEFLAALEDDRIDLILADYKLPSFDGLSALKLAVSARPDLPFIFVSGCLGEEIAIETLKIGATDYVLKTRLSRLVPSVHRALREAEERTERKKAEEALRRSERSLRELTETIPQMLWSAHTHGAVDYCNQRALDYTGLSAEQVRGGGWTKAVHEDDKERMAQAWSAAVSTGEPFQHEFRCLRSADRMYRWCMSSALPLRDQEGRVIKWFGSFVDLHDWKQAQQTLQMTEAELARVSRVTTMGELAASIAHEVNQPLTAVTNNANACLRLLARRNLDPEVLRRTLEEIVADGTRASAVIARIGAFIKKTPAERKELDINEVIQEVLALARRELSENQVLLEPQLTKALPPVLADRVQLQQVLLNLMMNGIEAMTGVTDRPRVLWVQCQVDESGDVLAAVRDSGTGLGVERDRFFAPFFTTKADGMGMGLPISRSIIEGHGGRLWAEPNFPHGAVFSFTLPVAAGSRP